jgi:hypothetical protein
MPTTATTEAAANATYLAFTDHLCKAWHLATRQSLPKTICGKTLFIEDDCQSDDLMKIGCGSCKRTSRYAEAMEEAVKAQLTEEPATVKAARTRARKRLAAKIAQPTA